MANIAERAAARAKARRVRHGVVAIAAAAALVAGGLATWNALDGNNGDGSVLVATQPDVPEQAEPAADQSAPVAGEADPAAVPQPGEPRANEIAPPAPQPADPPAADPDEVVEDSRGASSDLASEVPTPEDLSTGPTLTWTEVSLDASTGLTDVYGMESVGDGRIIALAWGDAGDSVVVTTDGTPRGATSPCRPVSLRTTSISPGIAGWSAVRTPPVPNASAGRSSPTTRVPPGPSWPSPSLPRRRCLRTARSGHGFDRS